MVSSDPVWVRLSSANIPVERQWDAWRDLISSNYEAGPRDEPAAGYEFDYVSFEQGPLLISHSRRAPASSLRTRERIKNSADDWFYVQMFLSGSLVGEADGADVRADPSGLFVMDMGRPLVGHAGGTEVVAVHIQRDDMAALAPNVDGLHGFAGATLLSELFRDHVVAMMRHAGSIAAADAHPLAEATRRLLRAALLQTSDSVAEAAVEVGSGLLRRAKAFIDRRLFSPDLSADHIAQQTGVSRRKLYQLFEPEGGVTRYIQRARLERAHAALSSGAGAYRVKEAAFDHGFISEAHFSRSFKRQFGFNASEAADRSEAVRRDRS